ncbi:MAG: ABC transporter substrate-binding protein [Eubacterium sp.]|nr:ABC transporter substrate-binding protein [Eubacterium sp.]
MKTFGGSFRRYINLILLMLFMSVSFFACGKAQKTDKKEKTNELFGHKIKESMTLSYAKEYSVDYYEGGLTLINIGEDKLLLLDEGVEKPSGAEAEGYMILQKPFDNIYLASSSSMDYFSALGELNKVTMTSTDIDDWSLNEVITSLQNEEMLYVGKYSAPDYEYILDEGCSLAIENTMIYHSPETKEKLEELGIPVLVEKSSREVDPLGRLEWIKLYGLLMDKTEIAEKIFNDECSKLNAIEERIKNDDDNSGKNLTAVCFYITASGIPSVRNPEDYLTKLVRKAGFKYSIDNISGNENKTFINMQMEQFFADSCDTDVMIYSASFEIAPANITELIEKDEMLKEFKAVEEKNVWCYNIDIFQNPTKMAEMTEEFYKIYEFTLNGGDEPELVYFYRLK